MSKLPALNPSKKVRFEVCIAAIFVVVVAFSFCSTLSIANAATIQSRGLTPPESWQQDAELTDVFFLDVLRGWAVGAQGVTLRTVDGGRNWLASEDETDGSVTQQTSRPLSEKLRDAIDKRQSAPNETLLSEFSKRPRHRLESVWFVDAENGWAAGGYDLPYVDRSRGVILRTTNGGKNWREVEDLIIPRIKQIQFTDRRIGWAIGETSNMSPNGIYYTSDGGLSWSSQQSVGTPDWKFAARTSTNFVAIDSAGWPAKVDSNLHEPAVITLSNAPVLAELKMKSDQQGWAVGSDGAVLQTINAGLSWSTIQTLANQSNALARFDFSTIAMTSDKVWFAGNPGHRIFSMNHDGTGLRAHQAPGLGSLQKIVFADQQHGWAVGSMGTIVATDDGGENWTLQRTFGEELAMLTVSRFVDAGITSNGLPLEMIARYGAEENYLCASVILMNNDKSNAAEKSRISLDTLGQACERAGGSQVVSVDVPSDLDPKTRQQVWLGKLVRTIRMFKPKSIVCDGHVGADGFSTESFVDMSIRMAADRTAFPNQIDELGLTTHQVDRLGVIDPIGEMGLDGQRLLPRLGTLLEDHLAVSRTIINQPVRRTDRLKYRVTRYIGRDALVRNPFPGELLRGVTGLKPRPDQETIRGSLNEIRRVSSKKNVFKQLLNMQPNSPQQLLNWRQALRVSTQELEGSVAGVWLAQLADAYLELGQPELAAFSLQQLISYSPGHDFAPMAMTWLAQYYSSAEFNQLQFQKSLQFQTTHLQANQIPAQTGGGMKVHGYQSKVQQATLAGGVKQYRWKEVELPPIDARKSKRNSVLNPNEMDLSLDEKEPATSLDPKQPMRMTNAQIEQFFGSRLKLATQYYSRLGGSDPDLILGEDYKFLQAHIIRQFAGSVESERYYKSLIRNDVDRDESGSVSKFALRELQLSQPVTEGASENATAKSETFVAIRAKDRPFLDGKFEDSVWLQAVKENRVIRKKFSHPDAISKTLTRDDAAGETKQPAVDAGVVAYDDEFLYLIFRCTKISSREYPESKQPRQRDADLSFRDRIEFELDVDRDGRTAARFAIDYRGCVNESCGGNHGWDPNWFVAHQQDENSWTVECAIPLNQLVVGLDRQHSPITINDTTGAKDAFVGSHWVIRMQRNISDQRDWWLEDSSNENQTYPISLTPRRGLFNGMKIDRRPSNLLRFAEPN